MGRLAVDRHSMREPGSEVDVRVEWTRSRKKQSAPKRSSSGHAGTATSSTHSQNSSPSGGNKRASLVSEFDKHRSVDSHRSRSPKGGENASESASDELDPRGPRAHREDDGEDDESDPEAYETPWNCTLMVTPRNYVGGLARTHSRRSSLSVGRPDVPITVTNATPDLAFTPSQSPIRLKIASLSPAPYHPKVVAQLKVPFPLPDVEIDRVEVRRRMVTSAGIARPVLDTSKPMGLILTAEEIKDILSSTALWVVVREGFGGVGKVNRKGDGWRIRG